MTFACNFWESEMESFRRVARCSASGLLAFAASLAWAADLTIPNTFVQGQPAVANEVNQNFSATATAVNSKQNRVTQPCSAGQAIRVVNQDGTVTCEAFATSNNRLVTLETVANSVQIFDSRDLSGAGQVSRGAGDSIGALINVATTTTITRISVVNEMTARGNLRFIIFDHPAHNRLLLTNPQPFAADAAGVTTWKDSVAINFTLVGGQSYDVGAIADVSAIWTFDFTADTALNITSVSSNANFFNFNNPSQVGHASVDTHVRLQGLLP